MPGSPQAWPWKPCIKYRFLLCLEGPRTLSKLLERAVFCLFVFFKQGNEGVTSVASWRHYRNKWESLIPLRYCGFMFFQFARKAVFIFPNCPFSLLYKYLLDCHFPPCPLLENRWQTSAFFLHFMLQELIPLILCTACLHPESRERDQLLHILFNLIKRPDDEQRCAHCDACGRYLHRCVKICEFDAVLFLFFFKTNDLDGMCCLCEARGSHARWGRASTAMLGAGTRHTAMQIDFPGFSIWLSCA